MSDDAFIDGAIPYIIDLDVKFTANKNYLKHK